MPRTRVIGTGFYVPENIVTNDDLAKLMDTNDDWIIQRTGIRERRYISEGQSNCDMSEAAARMAVQDAGIDLSDIDFIVLGSLSPDYTFPGNAPFLQERLGLNGCAVMEIRNQCTGFLYGLAVADKFIRTETFKTIMVVGTEIHSTGIEFADRGRDVTVIFGDGAGIFIVQATEEEGQEGIISTKLHADGKGAKDLWVECGDSAIYHPRLTHEMLDEGRIWPKMRGKKVFMEAIRKMPEVVLESLEGTGYKIEDVDAFIFHQANLRINEMVASSLNIPDEKVHNNIQKYGNTTAASIPIAFHEARQMGLIKEKSLVILAGFGAGFTWASILLRM